MHFAALKTPIRLALFGVLAALTAAGLLITTMGFSGGDSAAVQDKPGSAGTVVVFETETRPMTVFDDPQACNNAPDLAHTIMNFTDKDITLFADDRCGVELIDVRPGFGSHVAPGQSFADIS